VYRTIHVTADVAGAVFAMTIARYTRAGRDEP